MMYMKNEGSAEEEISPDAFRKTIHCIAFSTWFLVICCWATLSWWRLLSVQIRSAISKQHSHYSFSWTARIFVTISISQSCHCCRNFKSVPLSATVSCQFSVKSPPRSPAPFASTLSHPAPSSRPLHHFWHIRVKCFERGNLGNLFISLHKSKKEWFQGRFAMPLLISWNMNQARNLVWNKLQSKTRRSGVRRWCWNGDSDEEKKNNLNRKKAFKDMFWTFLDKESESGQIFLRFHI